MVTILTALRGVPALTSRWLRAATNGGASKIIAAVNNDADDEAIAGFGDGAASIPVTAYTGSDEIERVTHIAGIYGQLIQAADTELVILWDDDVLPPYKGLVRLAGAMPKPAPSLAGIVTVYPYPTSPEHAVLFVNPFEHTGAPISSVPQSGLMRVWGGGTGFSIWRRDVLLKTLPWTTAEIDGYVPGWDRGLAIKLHDMGARTLCETSIRCRHDTLP